MDRRKVYEITEEMLLDPDEYKEVGYGCVTL